MIVLCSLTDINRLENIDIKYALVRNYYKNRFPSVLPLPELAPSAALSRAQREKFKAGKWSEQVFEEWYKPLFLKEMKGFEAQVALDELVSKSARGINIALGDYESNTGTASRKLVGELLQQKGAEIRIFERKKDTDVNTEEEP